MRQPIKRKIAEANNTSENIYSLVVDGSNLLKISFVDKRMNGDGKEYGAVFTFIRKLGVILSKKDFNYCVVCWDKSNSGVLRWQYYKDYKANRDKNYGIKSEYDRTLEEFQRAVISHSRSKRAESDEESFERQKLLIQNMLEELCIRQYEYNDVEGDDIIANYVKNREENEKVVIVSSDRDLTQLICDNVIIFNPKGNKFITKDNSVKELGITHENIVIEKMICGDMSDNIKGVKGVGRQTLVKLFPEIIENKADLKAVIARSRELLDGRKAAGQKPLKSLENIVNGVTDGCQGDSLYEINRKIIDLSEPLLTDEAADDMESTMHCPMDTSDRDIRNVYKMIESNGMYDLLDEERFGDVFGPYGRIIMMEKRRFKKFATEKL